MKIRDQVLRATPLVLMYHSVAEFRSDPHNITVTPSVFERQMRWLKRRNIRGVGLTSLLSTEHVDRNFVSLTFDDGYADFATTVVPILHRFGFTATVYVLPGRFGGYNSWDKDAPQKPLMTEDQVREVAAAGMEIGSHGLRHVSLPELKYSELVTEVVRSRALIGELLNQQVRGFAYPYGRLGAREIHAVKAAGYEHACGVGRASPGSTHAISRSYVGQRDSDVRLAAKMIRHNVLWRRSS